MENPGIIYPDVPRRRPTVTVGTFREAQEETNLRPKLQKIKLYADHKALRIPHA